MFIACGESEVKIFVQERGSGVPIMFLHGASSSHGAWAPQVEHFEKRYRCLAWDAPWHGQSGRPGGRFNYSTVVRCLASCLDRLEAAPAHLVGLSGGTMTAAWLACERPDMVRSMTLIGSVIYGGELQAAGEDVLRRLASGAVRLGDGIAVEGILAPRTLASRADLVEFCRTNVNGGDPAVYADQVRETLKVDLRPRLASVDVPTLVLWGEYDHLGTPRAVNETTAKAIKGARLVVVPDAGHFTPLENAPFVNARIDEFLQGCERRPTGGGTS